MTEADRRRAIIQNVLRRLAEERERQGISKNALAAKAGLNQSVVSRLESGVASNPTIDSMLRIASALNVELGALLTRAGGAGKA